MNGGGQWRGWIVAAAIFVLGFAAGCACTLWIGGRIVRHRLIAPPETPSLAERAASRIGADLTKNLDLTPEQSKRVQAILDQTAARLKEVRIHARQDAVAEFRNATSRIANELPPDKRREFRQMIIQRLRRLGLPAQTTDQAPPEKP